MIRNVSLASVLNLYRAGIQLALNVVLAHFLSPADFGLVAMVLPITLFVLLIGDFGVTQAIVSQSPTPEEAGAAAMLCQGFGLAMIVLAVAAVLAGVVPAAVEGLVVAFAIVAGLAMTAIVPRALLERNLAYGRLTSVESLANTAGFAVAVAAAALKAGVWSFAAYHLTMQAIRVVLFGMATRGQAVRCRDWRKAGRLAGFGSWVAGFNLVNFVMRNFDRYIVGLWMGRAAVGLYAMGYQIMLVPLMTITWPVSGVLLSTLSRLRDQPAMQRQAFSAVLTLASCITLPMMAFVALRAELICAVIFPRNWAEAGPVIGAMAIAGGLQSVTALVGALFLMSGQVRTQFWFGVGATVLTLGTMAASAHAYGSLPVLARTYVALTAGLTLGYLATIARMLGTTILAIVRLLGPASGLVLAGMAGVTAAAPLTSALPDIARLLLDGLAFVAPVAALALVRRSMLIALVAVLRHSGRAADAGLAAA